jgi:hypothetical protein
MRLDEQAEIQTWLREHGCKRVETTSWLDSI